jgi:hypothetical protein
MTHVMIDADSEIFDEIFTARFIGDYHLICQEISYLTEKSKKENGLPPYLQEDLDFQVRMRDAIVVLMDYYLSEKKKNEVLSSLSLTDDD